MIELISWLSAARAIRHTCGNPDELDALIDEYTCRLAYLCWALE